LRRRTTADGHLDPSVPYWNCAAFLGKTTRAEEGAGKETGEGVGCRSTPGAAAVAALTGISPG